MFSTVTEFLLLLAFGLSPQAASPANASVLARASATVRIVRMILPCGSSTAGVHHRGQCSTAPAIGWERVSDLYPEAIDEPRIVNVVGMTVGVSGSSTPSKWASSIRAAASPIWRSGWRTELSGGSVVA